MNQWDYDYERGYAIAIARGHDDLADAFGQVYASDFAARLTPSEAFDTWAPLGLTIFRPRKRLDDRT